MSVTVKKKKGKGLSESDRDHALGGAETTIFSSRDSMTSPERDAVKKGENRGKVAVMNENPEKYNNIASIDSRIYGKQSSFMFETCFKCKKDRGKRLVAEEVGERLSRTQTACSSGLRRSHAGHSAR